uniref:protein O-GlcNAcase n=1 Tax=Steinernema glaseri TaxID=37863 RepID=A0A1I8AGY3_9BILA
MSTSETGNVANLPNSDLPLVSSSKNSENDGSTQTFICGVVEGFYGRPWTTDQRRHLFRQLRDLGMNTYLYAPKDDVKHRAEWRQLYTSEETDHLQSLITAAKECDITFVYALSPGIDIIYSSAKDVKAIQEKLTQVRTFGCNAFAILFDDIETTMNPQDKKHFSSFVMAQLTVTNTVFESLDSPMFFFCPTEYCESRAVPSLSESDYLSTLGQKLLPDIKIMWTGPRVVSRILTPEHIEKVSEVLRRKPVIWDNLHANDYDPKRVFLGPFAGRSVGLKQQLGGLLLNPNCKYEANFVPLHTLAEWNRCDGDAPDVENDRDATLEAGGAEPAAEIVVDKAKPIKLYHPLRALKEASKKWLEVYLQGLGPTIPPISQMETQTIAPIIEPVIISSTVPPPSIRTCEGNELLPHSDIPSPTYTSPIGTATTVTVQAFPLSNTIIGAAEAHDNMPLTVNSLTAEYSEPMDLASNLSFSSKEGIAPSSSRGASMTDVSMLDADDVVDDLVLSRNIDLDHIGLLVDIFYLPFEHGKRGNELLEEFTWLHSNAHVLRQCSDKSTSINCNEWFRRCEAFLRTVQLLTKLYNSIIDSPNKSLVQELLPYIWDAQGILSVVGVVIEWMRQGNLLTSPQDGLGNWWTNGEMDVEPWTLGGGMLPDLQKLLFTSTNVADIFLAKQTIPLSLTCYSLRPCPKTLEPNNFYEVLTSADEKNNFLNELMGVKDEYCFDRYFGAYVGIPVPDHNFVADEVLADGTLRPCAVIGAALNSQEFVETFKSVYIPRMRETYLNYVASLSLEDEALALQRVNKDLEAWVPIEFPEDFYNRYPSRIEIRYSSNVVAVAVRRLVHSAAATLAINGSTGMFTVVPKDEIEKIDLLLKLGLTEISTITTTGHVVLGHLL